MNCMSCGQKPNPIQGENLVMYHGRLRCGPCLNTYKGQLARSGSLPTPEALPAPQERCQRCEGRVENLLRSQVHCRPRNTDPLTATLCERCMRAWNSVALRSTYQALERFLATTPSADTVEEEEAP